MVTPIPKPVREIDPDYQDHIRRFACVVEEHAMYLPNGAPSHWTPCRGPVQFSHVVKTGHKGMGSKASDFRGVPHCEGHHQEFGQSRRDFEAKYGIDHEREIRQYNQGYRPKQKSIRERHAIATVKVKRCEGCQRTHDLPFSKVLEESNELTFTCPVSNVRSSARK